MKITGTQQEIEWLIQTVANGCSQCPYYEECNRKAAEENGKQPGVSCADFLKGKLEIIIEHNNI